jgi:hypothetical protein
MILEIGGVVSVRPSAHLLESEALDAWPRDGRGSPELEALTHDVWGRDEQRGKN